MEKNVIRGTYYKLGEGLMSGTNLPPVVRDTHFVECTFHANCKEVQFRNCSFEDCDLPAAMADLGNRINNITPGMTGERT